MYDNEQKELLAECEKLQKLYDELKAYFEANPHAKKRSGFLSWSYQTDLLRRQAEKYGMYDTYNDSDEYLQFRIIAAQLGQCKYRLKQSKTSRAIEDSVKFIGSITPQHVSGRMYKVENGDGCGMFCLWFCIIDAIIVLLYFLISVGK